ncbi:biotin-dependent carboxyltransferase family protein [Leifsonia sp. 21MFCrub1.1]|uniref:5-oxoprolinase subunit C family protein n=1 Tax=Leifsonia sp. 21MFCrub1.1 TaxID=1798223 RepID=UPI001E3CB124|nr:biotin-dependent carboxyltransferase family protein [Leifsonia sp. 21MFCrub1.1]
MRILSPGALALVQDLGRPGLAALGVGRSGALDRAALRLGNRLLGNDEGDAGIEVLLGGFEAVFEHDAWFAVTGATGPLLLDDRPVDAHQPVRAHPGQVLRIGSGTAGLRWYLTVRGGVAVPAVLGSRSRDTLAGLGPAPLRAGDRVPVGEHPGSDLPLLDFVPVADPAPGAVEVRAHRGPRADWFTPAALEAFFSVEWRVAPESDRIGARLDPVRAPAHAAGVTPHPDPLLERAVRHELPSEPMVAGAVQVSPDGRPTVLLADHPVTGGYPVIAVVADAALDAFAQLRPGQTLTFRHA